MTADGGDYILEITVPMFQLPLDRFAMAEARGEAMMRAVGVLSQFGQPLSPYEGGRVKVHVNNIVCTLLEVLNWRTHVRPYLTTDDWQSIQSVFDVKEDTTGERVNAWLLLHPDVEESLGLPIINSIVTFLRASSGGHS